jgi:AraC-like DNA-binding protein/quercetin dioxygenase-like cupin family protein
MARRGKKIAPLFAEKDFPLKVMRIASHAASGLHGHDFHELVVILGGSGRHVTTEEAYPIAQGDVFLISGETEHQYEDPRSLSLVNILFFPKVLRLPMAELGGLPGYQVLFLVEPKLRGQHRFRGRLQLTTKQLTEAEHLIERMEEELDQRRPGYRFMARTHLMHLIGYLSRCYADAGGASEHRPLFRLGEVLSHIENHYAEPITVEQLAQMASMSESSLMRTFRKVTGKSPIDYVIHVRVARAAELLQRDDANVTEVAFRCGFTDSNYFSRQFRRLRGRSPREYRRERKGL